MSREPPRGRIQKIRRDYWANRQDHPNVLELDNGDEGHREEQESDSSEKPATSNSLPRGSSDRQTMNVPVTFLHRRFPSMILHKRRQPTGIVQFRIAPDGASCCMRSRDVAVRSCVCRARSQHNAAVAGLWRTQRSARPSRSVRVCLPRSVTH